MYIIIMKTKRKRNAIKKLIGGGAYVSMQSLLLSLSVKLVEFSPLSLL